MSVENLRTVKFQLPQEAEVSEKLLAHPMMGQLLDKLSQTLDAELRPTVQLLANMKAGHRFRETGRGISVQTQMLTGRSLPPGPLQTFEFVAIALPHKPSIFMRLVAEYAKHPYETPTDTTMVIFHNAVEPGELAGYRTISMRDFCKNFAFGEWELVDELRIEHADDVFKEKNILAPVAEMERMTPGGIILP